MRALIFAAVMVLAACDASINAGKPGGYKLEVRADEAAQVFLVTAPNGHVVAARAEKGGASALLDDSAIHALLAEPAPAAATSTATTNNTNTVSIQAPGVSIQASGDDNDNNGKTDGKDDDADGEAHVSLNFGGHGMQIDANGHDGGDANHAHVVITGADEKAAHDFIVHADELSPAVQAQMLAALGLH